MFTILERMIETLSQMIKESMNQHVDLRCQHCGGPHWYEDCPVYVNQKIYQSTIPSTWDDYYDNDIGYESYGGEEELVDIKGVEEELPNNLELSDIGLETTTDDSVPPPVKQDVTPNWYSTPWYCGPEPIDDDFWRDDDEREEAKEEPLAKMDDEEIEEHIPSWEEEFGDELVGLPTLVDEKFDPVGDLAYLETLLEEKPTMEIKQIPNVEEEKVAEELDSRPVEKLAVGLPHTPTRTREKAQRNCLDQHIVRVRRWYEKKQKEKLKCRDNHLPRYMHRIRFDPC
ncbi:putative transcription factor interactor and regulator CCHC(Zn) family [Helianthus annuus]|uniref:Transcription factor interactor and regulator CCHC(Zn) family n=1 Tax=Helianthus annuus TaxID=4232 RepID=A0A9K3HTA1_HELAN|nr:putative transcription factor interactor and regulator CCHC(Zn) family [Helianthus annuus]KAJ0877229.1 putative transcription factor interactor and regulator CCHC(Zn) family [Helianthus annuus]